ncbi:MAG TPA: arylsulfatase [Phycisphaerales bacterium]|nr:arylsulfatase [Phycisphaerales bacterium]
MNRRVFLKMTLAAGTSALTGCGGALTGHARAGGKPNIVFIIADDLGWGDVGYHDSEIQTPNIDRLAAESVVLDRHYVMPTCTPTRVGLMTGHYPSRYGVTAPAYGAIFRDDTVTLAAALRSAGYETSIVGKWHMGSPPECTPLKYGFERSYGYFHGQCDPYTHIYKTGVPSWHRDDAYLDEQGHATDLITAEAVRTIERSSADRPLFLYVAYSVPHYPLDEPQEWLDLYGDMEEPSRRWYAAATTHMDAGIGRIIEALDERGLRKDTLIVFVSDNGGQKSWHSKTEYDGRYADKPHTVLGNNRPLRGWKGDLYEGGIRVPALINRPGVLEPARCAAPLHIVDWMPTLCRLVGYRSERELAWDGRDVWDALAGRAGELDGRTMYWKTPSQWAVRKGPWKLIVSKGNKAPELYDVVADPYETVDAAGAGPEQLAELQSLLESFRAGDREKADG